ncbi:response regulator [Patescibacteria group bacterium]|nr:response regulator [Patescibacteria group bacterium]MBU1246451.1 response regulator [Patescibacteria group bacterium]MBU1519398.1 response regulator [Patescibacteria group bacterium]MBU1730160.1 response regulator [Patescibacteria group bacterium]MBU1956701.1 response regulator [Patescibacteria group bacterium]
MKQKKILLVEDDLFIRELLARGFRDKGFLVDTAPCVEDGLNQLYKNTPDLILLDLLLPEKDGFYFLEEIKQKPSYKHIPVVVISNLGSQQHIKRAMDSGAADFLIKSNFTIDEIILKANGFFEKNQLAPDSDNQ